MRSIILDVNLTSQWLILIKEAQASLVIDLEKDLEAYLVFLLIRFINKPEMVNKNIGIDFLKSYHTATGHFKHQQQVQLQSLGDHCLLFSGFFPGRYQRKGPELSYFVKIGKLAYANLASVNPIYHDLSMKFTVLMDILLSIRGLANNSIDLKQALDLFENTHSHYAYHILKLNPKKISH